jgi:inosose dehydratase
MNSRREFIKLAGAGTMAAGITSALLPDFNNDTVVKGKKEDKFKLGIAGYSFLNFTVEKSIEMMVRLGVKRISLKDFHMPLSSTREQILGVLEKFHDAGIEVYAVGVVYMKSQAAVDQAFSYAQMAGVNLIVAAPDYELLPYVDKKVKSSDIRIAIHNHGPDNPLYPNPKDIWDHIVNLDEKIGICIDIGHTTRDGKDPASDIIKYGKRLCDVHIKDVTRAAKEGTTCEMGRGIIDIKGVVSSLRKIRYSGTCSLEFEKDMKDPLAGLAESIGYWKGILAS